MLKDFLISFALRSLLFPFRFLSYHSIGRCGKSLGLLCYYLIPSYRKRALSNLSIAKDLHLTNKEIKRFAKESFQNLLITCLEYPKLKFSKNLHKYIICENPEKAMKILSSGHGIIFFCGHQANWEVLFLDGTTRMPGIAIGRPIKNPFLYNWVVSIRERFGGKIVPPQKALKEGLRALKKGSFIGIVGDQGMPGSNYHSTFLGAKAWTSTAPALLSYKTNSPIIVATTRRKEGKYIIHYSDPIWPNLDESLDQQIPKLMSQSLLLFEESIKNEPGQWLWQHNRWKQEIADRVYYRFRFETLLILLPENKNDLAHLIDGVKSFREIYPSAFITIFYHESYKDIDLIDESEKRIYKNHEELFLDSYLHKLVFNFTGDLRLKKHFLNKSAFKVLSVEDLKKEAELNLGSYHTCEFKELLQNALLRRTSIRS